MDDNADVFPAPILHYGGPEGYTEYPTPYDKLRDRSDFIWGSLMVIALPILLPSRERGYTPLADRLDFAMMLTPVVLLVATILYFRRNRLACPVCQKVMQQQYYREKSGKYRKYYVCHRCRVKMHTYDLRDARKDEKVD